MADVCSVCGGQGRKILNLFKGIKIEPTPQHTRSHCTPPHNSRERDKHPVPQHESPQKGAFLTKHKRVWTLRAHSSKSQARIGAPEQVQTLRTGRGDDRHLKRAPKLEGDPKTLCDGKSVPKGAPEQTRTLGTL